MTEWTNKISSLSPAPGEIISLRKIHPDKSFIADVSEKLEKKKLEIVFVTNLELRASVDH